MSRINSDRRLIMNSRLQSSTRRRFMGGVVAVLAGTELASGQVGGDIRTRRSRASFSVEGGHLLESVAHTLIREYNWPVTFEQSVSVYPGDWIAVTRDFAGGSRSYALRRGRLDFSYDLGLRGAEPDDPSSVLRVAIDAYHQAGVPGRYELLESADYFRIVPTGRQDEAGEWQPERSLLESRVSVGGLGRTPEAVMRELHKLISESAGFEIMRGIHPIFGGFPQPTVVERFENARAREVFRALIAVSGQGHLWSLNTGLIEDKPGSTRMLGVLNLIPYWR